MYKITNKRLLTDNIYLMDIEAPRVAKSAQPGQFIIIKNNEKGERIPLTIADYNREEGIVTIVFQTVGYTTKELAKYEVGDYVKDFVGPLGQPSELIHEDLNHLKDKKLIFIAGGVGAAPVYPQVKWCHENNIDVDVIIGARNEELIILEEEMKKEISNIIYNKLKNPDVTGLISVTKVKVTTDLKFAKVYVSILNAKNTKATLRGLKQSSGFVRSEVAKSINLRNTPEIIFELDDSMEYGAKIDSILKDIMKDVKPESEGEE